MNVELRCPACGRGFVVDHSVREAPCPACGVSLDPEAFPASAGAESSEPSREAAREAAPPPAAKPARTPDPAPPPAGASARPLPQSPAPAEDVPEMVCPRCGLHFTPRAANQAPVRTGARRTVLVVEDMDYFQDVARDALEPRFHVKAAGSVDEARSSLADGDVDLILLDLTLQGGEDGARLLQELPAKPCPVLIYTSDDEQVMYGDTWKHLQDLGADDVVIKGMNVGESILRKVGSLLGEPTEDDSSSSA